MYRFDDGSPDGVVRASIVSAPMLTSSSFARSMVATETRMRSAIVLRALRVCVLLSIAFFSGGGGCSGGRNECGNGACSCGGGDCSYGDGGGVCGKMGKLQ